jgi:hypothetical protein
MKILQILTLAVALTACSKSPEIDSIVDSDMKATLTEYMNAPNEFPVYLYAVDYKQNYPNNKVLLDSTTNKQMSIEIPYIVANRRRYDIRKIWGMREAKKETIPTKLITTELKIEFMK